MLKYPIVMALTVMAMMSLLDQTLMALANPSRVHKRNHTAEAEDKSPLLATWMAGMDDPDYNPEVTDFTDWSCQPSEEHPNPVILLHGLLSTSFTSLAYMAEKLVKSGYCVYQLKYGMVPELPTVGGMGDIRDSAKEVSTFVKKVLRSTNAPKVDLIGYSEGTVVSRWYVKFLDGHKKVRSVVSIAPVGKGTSLQGILGVSKVFGMFTPLTDAVQQICPACVQLLEGSDLLQELYADGQEIVPGIRYLNILTENDQMVTPFTNGLMDLDSEPDALVRTEEDVGQIQSENLILEDYCEQDSTHSNHFALFRSPFAFNAANAFLTDDNGSVKSNTLKCT
ncbi:hypothetical protein BGX28_003421 [Mortierella sp. GBA30]|nr:hypothetical protein BGX28_003421 [Mortierella sp. GBA30]